MIFCLFSSLIICVFLEGESNSYAELASGKKFIVAESVVDQLFFLYCYYYLIILNSL